MLQLRDLISKEYAIEQRVLHARPKGYGGKGDKWAEAVVELARTFDCGSILDYGCGQGRLITAIKQLPQFGRRLDEYDPGIPGKDTLPSFADLVVCTDVLEHVEPERLDTVLKHLEMLARRVIFLVVSTKESNKYLSDGRNAHLTVESAAWWQDRVTSVTGWQALPAIPPRHKSPKEWVSIVCPR